MLATGPLHGAHLDLVLHVREGHLATGAFDFEGQQHQEDARTFVTILPESGPTFTESPGFSALVGSGLPAGSRVGFELLGPLEYWDGHGAVDFGPPDRESLRISVGPLAIESNGQSGPGQGFEFAQVSAGGTFHRHPTYALLAADGNANPDDGVRPAAGVYVATLALRTSDPSIAPSDPVWLVFGYFAPQSARAAADWIGDYRELGLVPGDADGDGRVDLADFGTLKDHFGLAGSRRQGDFNGDRRSDLADFGLLKQNFGAAARASTVPEPSASAPAVLGLLALMRCGRRRRRRTNVFGACFISSFCTKECLP